MRLLAIAVGVLVGLSGCKGEEKPEPTKPNAPASPASDTKALVATAAIVLEELVKLETERDVTCWTSFRQLDWFIAEKSYSEFGTLSKVSAIKTLVRAAWAEASVTGKGKTVGAGDLEAIAKRLPQVGIAVDKRGKLESFANDIGLQNFTDYQKTAEHLRVVLAIVQDEIYRQGTLKPLDREGVLALADVATTLSLMLLKDSSASAKEQRRALIEGEDVQVAYKKIRATYALENPKSKASPLPYVQTIKVLGPLTRSLIQGKAKALATFNKGSADYVANLNRVARVPLTKDAAEILQVRLQSFVHFVAAGKAPMRADNYLDDGAYANTKFERRAFLDFIWVQNTIMQLFPHHTLNNGDVVVRFEPNPGPMTGKKLEPYEIRLLDHEMNGVRDSAIHWFVLAKEWSEKPYAIDPFAAEYLSEVASMMMTMYLRRGEMLAKQMGKKEIDADIARRIHDKSYVMVPPQAAGKSAWNPDKIAAKKKLLGTYGATLFADVTKQAGLPLTLERFGDGKGPVAANSAAGFDLQRIMGGGIAVGDVNSDGYPDLFVTGEELGKLYVNRGVAAPGTFVDETTKWGIPEDLDDAHGTLFFDLEGDGDADLLVLRAKHPSLLLVQERGKFVDKAGALGLKTHDGAHVASVFDYDGDGDLDIYVGYYGNHEINSGAAKGRSLPTLDGRNGSPNQLWKQGKDGRLSEAAVQAGVADVGWTLAAGAFDHDMDGDLDLYIANDFGPNRLFENDGDGTFTDITDETHTGDRGSGMNVDFTDLNGDGRWDFYVTNIDMFSKRIKVVFPRDESTIDIDESLVQAFQYLSGNKLYVSKDKRAYEPLEAKAIEPGDRGWGWDASFFDYDLDGDDDLYVTNGWINGSYAGNQANQLFLWDQGTFFRGPESSGETFRGNTRSTAAIDIDRDGDIDLVANQFRQPPRVLRNQQKTSNHFIQIALKGRGKNVGAVGARVVIKAGQRTLLRHFQAGRGYLSQGDTAIHAGLGTATKASVTVHWPDGKEQTVELAADKLHEIAQPGS